MQELSEMTQLVLRDDWTVIQDLRLRKVFLLLRIDVNLQINVMINLC